MDSERWNQRYVERELEHGREANLFVRRELASLAPSGRALDLACGEGRNAVWLAEQGWEVQAVDFSGVALERARALGEQRGVALEWREADLGDQIECPPSFLNHRFDASEINLRLPASRHAADQTGREPAPGKQPPHGRDRRFLIRSGGDGLEGGRAEVEGGGAPRGFKGPDGDQAASFQPPECLACGAGRLEQV